MTKTNNVSLAEYCWNYEFTIYFFICSNKYLPNFILICKVITRIMKDFMSSILEELQCHLIIKRANFKNVH